MNSLQIIAGAKSKLIDDQFTEVNPARDNFIEFVRETKQDYQFCWHNIFLANKLNDFANGKIKKLMVFMPPQHGKSELVSRRLPPYLLGRNPKLKVIGASFSSDLSSTFNRDVQRIIDTPEYHKIFPKTTLNGSNVRSNARGNWLRNADIFEIVDYGGFYKSVGVGGSLTGTPADIAIIDDVIKDAMEANSQTVRDNIFDWYVNVLRTRLHNNSQEIMTLTRWHEDDLPGRLLVKEPNKWEIVIFPAIKENNDDPNDPRQIGEPLWGDRHSLEKLLETKSLSARTFTSLYQQKPSPDEGDVFKVQWFKRFKSVDLPAYVVKHFQSDTAYGKEKSDNSSTLCYSLYNNNLYIWDRHSVNLPFPEFIKSYKDFVYRNGVTPSSKCYIEPKASGISSIQQLRTEKLPNGTSLNIISDRSPKEDKTTRAKAVSPIVESGRVYLLEGASWIESFLTEIRMFPNGSKDDDVDTLTAVLLREYFTPPATVRIENAF